MKTCAFQWCEKDHAADTRPDPYAIVHEKTFARFEDDGAVVRVAVTLAVFTRTGVTAGPSIYVFRDNRIDLELAPAILDGLIAILRNLNPADLKAFTAALTESVKFVRRHRRENR